VFEEATMRILAEDFVLPGGAKIPKLGFGTWQIPAGATDRAVSRALAIGYRHIDTARAYGNEAGVGKAVRESGRPRDQLFVTSKLPAEVKSYRGALQSFDRTMEALGLDYLDLYLVHAPWPWNEIGADYRRENLEVWRAMEELHGSGRCRAIGVSNFARADLEPILEACRVRPAANQIEFFIGNTQPEVVAFCREEGILVEGYSPLATGRILGNAPIAALAEKYGVTLPQLCIRYVLQKGVLPLVKSVHEEYMRENADVDFEIADEDVRYLDGLHGTAPGLFANP
jgi:diketogulonate reductase-like aldo/keto reductase